MHLYDCRMGTFIPQATSGQIADILQRRFVVRLESHPSESEVRSWENSLGAFADAVSGVGMDDSWIVLEYQLPLSSSRVDCMLLGSDQMRRDNAVLVEFKQWSRCIPSPVPELIDLGGVEHLHPSAQVQAYRRYLGDSHTAFHSGQARLSSCAYLHNVTDDNRSGFYAPYYKDLLSDSPLFSLNTADELARFVGEKTASGSDDTFVEHVLSSSYRPSRALLNYVADAIDDYEPWQLLDEQLVSYNRIMSAIEDAKDAENKTVLIVLGEPGTGKSVIAIQVVGAAARKGYNVAHATGSKAFTTNLRGVIGREVPFRYTHNFRDADANELDLIVCDEAHRLRVRTQFGPRIYSRRPQGEEIIDAAKVSVFLLDDHQSVRLNEQGSVSSLTQYAESQGASVIVERLGTQFRCAGSESYIRWIEHVLGLAPKGSLAWLHNDEYEVRIFDRVQQMRDALQEKRADGNTARMVAGFCWPWSDPEPDGRLVNDVEIGAWSMPWNRKPREMWRSRRGRPEDPESHPYTVWATEPSGFDEIGCIYSAQGFEFDYVGVIFGRDMRWSPAKDRWVADLSESHDSSFKRGLTRNEELAVERLAHIYRVLGTRGMKGTFFYFLDKATRKHFENKIGTG